MDADSDQGGNLRLELHRPKDMRLKECPIPEIGPFDCLIAINSVGICGSDIHFWTRGRIGDKIMTKPIVLGHETSGTIEKVGSKVSKFKPGDRITLDVVVSCSRCEFCKIGRHNLCSKLNFASSSHGTLTRYYALPEDFCLKLPDGVSFEEGALVEPLAVACINYGPIGLLCMMVAKASGIYKCCVTDLSSNRLIMAKDLGADYILCITTEMTESHIAKKIEEIMDGKPDVTIECSGAESAIRTGILVIS
uniref:Sorbitol dehydrogenase n=1 Tax=Strigamia maritima TaxID=126957 RepID=T1JHB8_STRMM